MNFLKQVITLLSQYEQKIDVFNEQELENTAFERLYTGVKLGKYDSDYEAAQDIYREENTDARYRNLKSRLKRKLSNHLFFLIIDQPDHSESLSVKYETERQFFIMKILAALGATKTAYETALQILPTARKYHLTSIIIECLQLIRERVAYLGDTKDFQNYSSLLQNYIRVQEAEFIAAEHLQLYKMNFASVKSINPDLVEKTKKSLLVIRTLWDEYKSYSLFLSFFRMSLYFQQIFGDYAKAIEVCQIATDYFKINPHLATNNRLIEIALHKNLCYLYLRQYDEGINNIKDVLPLLQEGSTVWFDFMEEYFLLFFHSGNTEKASRVYSSVVNHISYTTVLARHRETWEIFGLYLSFVEGKGNPDMDRFMKDMEVFRYDKSGVYVTVLALSILILLRNGDYDTILNRDEYIKKYLARYLKGDDHVRSAAFFRLLRLMIRKEFNLPQILKTGAKDIAVLHDQSLRLDDYEVMPYEKMWHIVVEVLEGKSRTLTTAQHNNIAQK